MNQERDLCAKCLGPIRQDTGVCMLGHSGTAADLDGQCEVLVLGKRCRIHAGFGASDRSKCFWHDKIAGREDSWTFADFRDVFLPRAVAIYPEVWAGTVDELWDKVNGMGDDAARVG